MATNDFEMFKQFMEFKKMMASTASTSNPVVSYAEAVKTPQTPLRPEALPWRPVTQPSVQPSAFNWDPKKCLECVFTKMGCNFNLSKYSILFSVLRNLYKTSPENFTLLNEGKIHTNADGDRTYFSVKVTLDTHGDKSTDGILHLYGVMRGARFTVKTVDVHFYKQHYENAFVFIRSDDSDSLSSVSS